MSVTFKKSNNQSHDFEVMVNGIVSGKATRSGGTWITVNMNDPIFPIRRPGESGFEKSAIFRQHKEAKISISRAIERSTSK